MTTDYLVDDVFIQCNTCKKLALRYVEKGIAKKTFATETQCCDCFDKERKATQMAGDPQDVNKINSGWFNLFGSFPPLNSIGFISLGWKCPSCGRCYAPLMTMCSFCPGAAAEVAGTTIVPDGNRWKHEEGYMVPCPSCGCTPCMHSHTGCPPVRGVEPFETMKPSPGCRFLTMDDLRYIADRLTESASTM